ncbi:putative (S)-N-methylcoclaurine 3'-hydroxylase isozyme 2 [Tasmannia lanceolata]|uniref:putative (S)-N-methylcoclaurine 3'-hydroxylase isozyme 2 n=1 Tax=Tasmannia lanceolata TaxID=3420 RepID=UPI0040634D0C
MAIATDNQIVLPLLPLLILLPILLFVFNHIRKTTTSKSPLPPGPTPWPIIGNLLDMGKKPHIALARLTETYGAAPLISLRLGSPLLVVGSTAAAATQILKTHDRLLSARHVPNITTIKRPDPYDWSIIWAPECTDQWKQLRTICRSELFSTKSINGQAPVREKKVMEMVNFLVGKEGKVVKLDEVVFGTVFNMLGNIYVSKDFIELEDGVVAGEMKELFSQMGDMTTVPNIADFYPMFARFDLQGLKKKAWDFTDRASSIWEVSIQQRRDGKDGDVSRRRDFLDVLIEKEFTNNQINNLLMELFTAGVDTSVTTIEWGMAELIKHPEAMNKVIEELKREIKENVVESDLPNLPYLHACVKETLRLHPPVPLLLPHRALEDCEMMNYRVPKDSLVQVNAWAIGRDPASWKDPLNFKPERFLDPNLDYKGNDFGFIPFGAGRRICPGLPMATRQIRLIMACMIYYFDWSLPCDMNPNQLDMNEKFGITLQKEQTLLLIPKCKK